MSSSYATEFISRFLLLTFTLYLGYRTPTLPLSITSQPFSMLPFPTSNKMIILTRSITWYDSKMMRNFNCVLYGLLQPRLDGISA